MRVKSACLTKRKRIFIHATHPSTIRLFEEFGLLVGCEELTRSLFHRECSFISFGKSNPQQNRHLIAYHYQLKC